MSDDITSHSDFPPWLPLAVANWIDENRTHPEHVRGRDLIDRLASDEKLRTLWNELQKKKRTGFVYAPNKKALETICGTCPDDESERQGIALIWLFKQLLHFSIAPQTAATMASYQSEVEQLKNRARMLREEADDTEKLPPMAGGIDWRGAASGMRAKADVLEQKIRLIGERRLILENDRHNKDGLQTGADVSAMFNALFGKPLYEQSAAIANALTGQRVTFEQIRHVTKTHHCSVTFAPQRR
ncbi:hypothetical protein [Acidocella aminolytica]|uniref:Uncharacterized protein n=2 Tax=Acidocella TaxID=50709 RepID=A0A0D6PCT1_9PROT|nr:hypothetical protein [Acidocella aminolytica]GAN79028.1 hypothetical protein Aam_015_038 [Acidocella aminolytica 101 = DSM 11237]SHF37929.1 hypothetical protein SAMN02746095_03044 [Acidocella aminolytica 101 = DSM 11237]